jgi:hypothetical protein
VYVYFFKQLEVQVEKQKMQRHQNNNNVKSVINQSINQSYTTLILEPVRYITAVEKNEISIVKQDCTQKVNIKRTK